MREIKFRAWDQKIKQMVPATNLVLLPGKTIACGSLPWETWKETHIIENNLMQFTGLKDKNGKEIYEGDIVKRFWSNDTAQITHVVWHNHKACFTYAQCEYDWDGLFDTKDWEVIGNIYENPELLDKK